MDFFFIPAGSSSDQADGLGIIVQISGTALSHRMAHSLKHG
jgi:hypothetical protein